MLLSYKNENILIDCGEGTQRQFRLSSLSPTKITKILLTHKHGDHILGLPGLFQTLAMSDYEKSLSLYGPKGISRIIKTIEDLIGRIRIKLDVNEVSSRVFENSDFIIQAAQMNHDTPCLAYSFIIKDKIRLEKSKLKKLKIPHSPLLKKLQQGKSIKYKGKTIFPKSVSYIEKGRKITFILDTALNENAIKLAKSSDLLICESTFLDSEESLAKSYKHLTAKQAAQIAKKSKSKALILTHISPRYDQSPEKILKESRAIFPNTNIVKDLDQIEL